MKKAVEYREHAQECRAVARNAQNADQRTQLLMMAETWENLAAERERMLRKQQGGAATFDSLTLPVAAAPRPDQSL